MQTQSNTADTPIDDLDKITDAPAIEHDSLSEDELDMMTEAERAAYNGNIDDGDDDTAEGDDDTTSEGDTGEDEGEGGDDTLVVGETEEERVAREQAETQAAAEAEAERLQQQRQQEQTLEQQKAAAEAARDNITEQYMNGDLDDDAYRVKLKEAQAHFDQINFALGAAKQPAMSAWETACASFLDDHSVLNTDLHFTAFNKTVGDMSEDPRFSNLTDTALLEAARKRYALEMELAGTPLAEPENTKPAANEKEAAQPEQKKVELKPASERPSGPTTLNDIPSETVDPNQGQMSQLEAKFERADPAERERMMASMPEHIQEAFMNF